jgi:carboxylate-amine ligase
LSKIVDGAKIILNEQVKMHQSVVEVGTNICMNVADEEKEIKFCDENLVADKQVKCGGAGTHQNGKTTHY